jgi:hypothetical protein
MQALDHLALELMHQIIIRYPQEIQLQSQEIIPIFLHQEAALQEEVLEEVAALVVEAVEAVEVKFDLIITT